MQPRRLLFATDFGAASELARDYALQLAKAFDADLTVLHVLESPPPYPYPVSLLESARALVEAELDRLTDAFRQSGVRAERVLLCGSPATEIVATAEEQEAHWIVMGTHGRQGASHLLLGSVAENVVRLSHLPVLTIPPSRERRGPAGK